MGRDPRERPRTATFANLPLSGVSAAGRETWFHFPTLRLAFDLGRAPTELVPVSSLFLSHAHLDHAAGLAWWCSQRRLQRMPGGVVRTHAEAVPLWREILALHERLEGVRYDARVEAMEPGAAVQLRRDLSVAAFRVDHRVPTLGFLASEVKRKLLPAFEGRPPEEVRAAANRGEEVAREVSVPLVAYSGDTAAGFSVSRLPKSSGRSSSSSSAPSSRSATGTALGPGSTSISPRSRSGPTSSRTSFSS